MSIGEDLNEQQQNVVLQADGPCLVLAGAGSGKTRTITYRVAHLLEKGVAPENMLLVTFTNKASREMLKRVEELTGGQKLPWAGTYHHIAFRILKQYGGLLGYSNNFTILDSGDSKDLIKLCVKVEGVQKSGRKFPSAAVIKHIISFSRNARRTVLDVIDEKHPQWVMYAEQISLIAGEYEKRKKESQTMDFDDLLVNLDLLLEVQPAIRNKFANQFQYILVDEYQDTNAIQAHIISQLASVHKNILVVGDDAQSIYSFRAADIQNILAFEKEYPGAKIFRLETNYRSTPNILNVANTIIANNVDQYQKELRAVREPFVKPQVHAFADQSEEAEFIANEIASIIDEGVELSDISVLFRAAFHSQALEVELIKRNIPYEYRGGVKFFDRAHIKDALAFLKLRENRKDEVAWSRVLTMQPGIGPASMQKIVQAITVAGGVSSEIEMKVSAKALLGYNQFVRMWEELEKVPQMPSTLIHTLLDGPYGDYLESEYPDYRDREQDLEQLAQFSEKYNDLHSFLAEIALQESFTLRQAQRDVQHEGEKVILSTIHQSKGLEWHAVFVMHVAAGQFPSDRSLGERHGVEEERRLFYVAVTRAKKQLYLSYPLLSGRGMVIGGPSLFLSEIDHDLVDSHHIGGSTVFSNPADGLSDITYVAEDGWQDEDSTPVTSFLKSLDDL